MRPDAACLMILIVMLNSGCERKAETPIVSVDQFIGSGLDYMEPLHVHRAVVDATTAAETMPTLFAKVFPDVLPSDLVAPYERMNCFVMRDRRAMHVAYVRRGDTLFHFVTPK